MGDRVNMDATEVRVNIGDLREGHGGCQGPILGCTGEPFSLCGVKYLGEARD